MRSLFCIQKTNVTNFGVHYNALLTLKLRMEQILNRRKTLQAPYTQPFQLSHVSFDQNLHVLLDQDPIFLNGVYTTWPK